MEAASLDSGARFKVEDLLNFTLDAAEEGVDNEKPIKVSSFSSSNSKREDPDLQSLPLPEFAEEELEWLSNKDAFPAVETCFDILPGVVLNHQSPVSVLENSSNSSSSTSTSNNSTITSCCSGSILVPVGYPVKARSKRLRRHRQGFSDLPSQQCWWWNQANLKNAKQQVLPIAPPPSNTTTIGRRCQHCHAEKTPQWRAGPMGPKTLCNACGVRYKSGRLVPEYRPASSPTFSSLLHSNSHRKIVEMRRQQQEGGRKTVDIGG